MMAAACAREPISPDRTRHRSVDADDNLNDNGVGSDDGRNDNGDDGWQ